MIYAGSWGSGQVGILLVQVTAVHFMCVCGCATTTYTLMTAVDSLGLIGVDGVDLQSILSGFTGA